MQINQPQTDLSMIGAASKTKPTRKPKPIDGPCQKALREAQAVMARHRSGELSKSEADRLVDQIVARVE